MIWYRVPPVPRISNPLSTRSLSLLPPPPPPVGPPARASPHLLTPSSSLWYFLSRSLWLIGIPCCPKNAFFYTYPSLNFSDFCLLFLIAFNGSVGSLIPLPIRPESGFLLVPVVLQKIRLWGISFGEFIVLISCGELGRFNAARFGFRC